MEFLFHPPSTLWFQTLHAPILQMSHTLPARPRIALANCRQLPEPDVDYEPLAAALRRLDCDVAPFPWDGDQDLREFDACVLRATWNYYHEPKRFLRWIDAADRQCCLINSAPIVRWNADKHYLRELEQAGTSIVETTWLEQGSNPAELTSVLSARRWSAFVLKPTVSAASFGTRSFAADQATEAVEFLAEHLARRAMMAQPFMASTAEVGEKSIAWIDGQITHAWTKRPRFDGEDERAVPRAEVTLHDLAVVEQALRGRREQILYARVDLMYDDDRRPRLSELELIEPSLYFGFCPAAAERFARGVLRRIASQAGQAR